MKRSTDMLLDDILGSMESIFAFINGYNSEEFQRDDKTLSAVIRKLEIIGEAAKNIPPDIVDASPDIPWTCMAKMRDGLIHGYFGVGAESVRETVHGRLPSS
ncbi:MAG TPA: DUF86 domain-containing protein [Spirochaetota bacterium]|nr:DUF86 domain-containing protein [Spirochaetota bacterium]